MCLTQDTVYLSLNEKPRKVEVYVDYEEGEVSQCGGQVSYLLFHWLNLH